MAKITITYEQKEIIALINKALAKDYIIKSAQVHYHEDNDATDCISLTLEVDIVSKSMEPQVPGRCRED